MYIFIYLELCSDFNCILMHIFLSYMMCSGNIVFAIVCVSKRL